MHNVQNCDSYINIPSSQTYRAYIQVFFKVYFYRMFYGHDFTYYYLNCCIVRNLVREEDRYSDTCLMFLCEDNGFIHRIKEGIKENCRYSVRLNSM
jgi:hypothetical protein